MPYVSTWMQQRQRFAQDMLAHEEQLYTTDYTPFLSVSAPKMPVIPHALGRPLFLPVQGEPGQWGCC